MGLEASDIGVELLAPGAAVAALIAFIKTPFPIPHRVLPLLALALGAGYAVLAAFTRDDIVDKDPLAIIVLAISIGWSASGLQGWVRSQSEVSSTIDMLPGTRRREPGGE